MKLFKPKTPVSIEMSPEERDSICENGQDVTMVSSKGDEYFGSAVKGGCGVMVYFPGVSLDDLNDS